VTWNSSACDPDIINTGPQATPSVVKGRLYTYGITGVLSCFAAENGRLVWQIDVFKTLKVDLPRFGATSSPLGVGNRVLVAVGGEGSAVVAFDTDTGEVACKALDGPISTASPIVYLNRSKKAEASLEAVFINNRSLVALNPFDGAVSWEHALSDQPVGTSPSPVVAGDLLLASSAYEGGVGVQLTHQDGKTTTAEAWKNANLSGYFSTPVAVGKDHFYMVTNQNKPQPTATLRCIEVKGGKELWSQPKVGFFHAGLLRAADDKLLLLDDAGNLRLLEHDPKGYHELAKAKVCSSTFVTPALANGRL
jgi:outer membrane protein assembly factor BamB